MQCRDSTRTNVNVFNSHKTGVQGRCNPHYLVEHRDSLMLLLNRLPKNNKTIALRKLIKTITLIIIITHQTLNSNNGYCAKGNERMTTAKTM